MPDDLQVTVSLPNGPPTRAPKLGEGLKVYLHFTAHATGPALPFDVDVEASYVQGRFRVKQLSARQRRKGDEITTDGLRKIPVGRILQKAIGAVVVGDTEAMKQLTEAAVNLEDSRFLPLVATLYRLAHAVNLPPTAYVAEQLKVPKSTAGRYVGLARKAGHLGPALGTKAGEG